jgi:hypothetical protein
MLSAVPTLGVLVLPMRFGDPVVGVADVTARRSVTHLTFAHLTFANTCWRSVQTFLVLLRTEAGGMPAFQSAPLRGYCRLRRRVTVWNINTIPAPSGRGQASPLQREHFSFLPADNFFLPADNFLLPADNFFLPADNFFLPRDNFFLPRDNFFLPRDNFLLSRDNFLLSRDNFFLSRDNFFLPRDNFFLSRDNFLLSRDNFFLPADNFFLSRDNFFLPHDNFFLSRDNFFLSRDNFFLPHDNFFLSRDNFFLTRDNFFLTHDNFFLPRDNFFLSRDNFFLSRDNFFLSRDNFLLSRDNFLLSRDKFFLGGNHLDVWWFGFTDACSAPLFSSCFARRKHNRPAVGCLPYVAGAFYAACGRGQASPLQRQHFLVWGDRNSDSCWRSGCRLVPMLFTKKARRSVTHLTLPMRVPLLLGRGQASPLQRQHFLVLGDRNSDSCWRSGCRLVPTLFTKKARRSVTHLTLPVRVPLLLGRGQASPLQRQRFFGFTDAFSIFLRFLRLKNYFSKKQEHCAGACC